MNEHRKLSEADYFLKGMGTAQEDPEAFTHELSAFLSAARSVLQYACEEAKMKPGGHAWYNAKMASDSVLTFFKDKRDFNIHEAPVDLSGVVEIGITDHVIKPSDSLAITITDPEGNVVETVHGRSEEPAAMPEEGQVHIKHRYEFRDWPGKDDVLSLCQSYLTQLNAIVKDGVRQGFITG